MLTLNSAQMAAFEDAAMRAFEDRTYRHLERYFPRHCLLLGQPQMRRVIRLGWQKAQSYDLTAECCVRSYIDLMCLLGSGFDTDPLMPWATRILNDKMVFGEVERGDRLYDQAWAYIDAISADYRDAQGRPTTQRFIHEIRALRQGNDEVVGDSGYAELAAGLEFRLRTSFPAKCEYVGARRVQRLVALGPGSAADYGIDTERAITLFTIFLFVLGAGFADDPLLPWAGATLNDAGIRNPVLRVDRLYAEGVDFLRRWWDSAPEQEG